MRPILALNCLLQTEQERSEEESSVGDALALAFRSACLLIKYPPLRNQNITDGWNDILMDNAKTVYTLHKHSL